MFHHLGSLIGEVSDRPANTVVAAVLTALAFGLFQFAFQMGLARLGVSPLADAVLDAVLCGLFFGLLIWIFLLGIRERRARVRKELERISELNHEIRNALEIITHSHFDAEAPHRAMVLDSVNRIDTVLRRIFPAVGVGRSS
jgi:MFS superfamily sulfate permease-like transporter